MKKLQLLALLLLFGIAAFAQNQPKVYAVINTATWCPACQANGERVETDIVAAYSSITEISFLTNNLSDKATKKSSKAMLEKEGVYKAIEKITSTGLIILVNAETHEVIKQLSVTETTDALKNEIDAAIKG